MTLPATTSPPDDVVFSTQKLIESGMNFKWYMFGDIKKVDDYTVEYTWTKPITDVGELEFPWCRTVIFSQKAFEAGTTLPPTLLVPVRMW